MNKANKKIHGLLFGGEYDLEQDLATDPDNLVEEWLIQPFLYLKYAIAWAKKSRSKKRKHEQVKVRKAELVSNFKKKNPKANQMELDAYFRKDKEYKKLKKELIDLEFEEDILDQARWAFKDRKDELSGLIRLYEDEYYAGPKDKKVLEAGKRFLSMKKILDLEEKDNTSSKSRGKRRKK